MFIKNFHGEENICSLQEVICEYKQSCENCKIAIMHEKKYFKNDRIRKTTLIFTGAIVTLVTVITPANAVSGVGDIVYDPVNYVQNFKSALQAVTQVENQYRQIEMQFTSLAHEATSLNNQAKNLTRDVTNIDGLRTAYNNLIKVQNYMNSLVSDYTKAQAAWDRTYPDFAKMNRVSAKEYGNQAYNAWYASSQAVKNAKTANALARQNAQITQAQVDNLIAKSDSAEGALQAAQIGNKLAYAQSQQLQQLIGVFTESSEAQNNYIMQQIRDKEAAKKQLEEEDLDTSDLPSLKNPVKGADYPVFK